MNYGIIGLSQIKIIILLFHKSLEDKIEDKISKLEIGLSTKEKPIKGGAKVSKENAYDAHLVKETLAACQGLGFKDQDVLPMIQRHLQAGTTSKPEDLVKIILKELR